MRVVFFGTPQFSADFLKALIDETSIDVVGVVCQPDEPVGRKKIITAPATKIVAEEHRIPVFQPTKLKDESFITAIVSLHADVAVIVAYGRILPKILLDLIPNGFINVHPSLLPKYRGPSPMQAAIANMDSITGVTIMKINEGMDTGPILAQVPIELAVTETTESLTQKVVSIGAPLLIEAIKGYMNGSITPIAQSIENISICRLLTKEDGKIDWTQSAGLIDAKIRAYTPWPGCWTTWKIDEKEVQVKIIEVKMNSGVRSQNMNSTVSYPFISENTLFIECGKNTFLQIITLQPAGGKPMNGADFIRGYL